MLAHCFNCGGKSIKYGRSRNDVQRYYCKVCKKSFQQTYSYKACAYGNSQKIIALVKESCGIRSIARLLCISVSTVINRIKAIGSRIQRPFVILQHKEYELDEMRTFIGNKKNLYWIVYAIRKDTREVIDFKVGKRTQKTMKRVVETLLLSDAKRIFTDGYGLYRQLIPNEIHDRSAYRTNHIERKNLSVRTHLKRLSRRTICFSRSVQILEACLRIYFWQPDR